MQTFTKVAGITMTDDRREFAAELMEQQNYVRQADNDITGIEEINDKTWEFNRMASLVREADNEFDPNAIAVFVRTVTGNRQLGYIPKDVAAKLAPLMDEGADLRAVITLMTGGGEKNIGANLRITEIISEGG